MCLWVLVLLMVLMVVVLLVVEKVVLMELGLDLMLPRFQHTNRLNIMLAWTRRLLPVPVVLTDPSYLSVLEHFSDLTELN